MAMQCAMDKDAYVKSIIQGMFIGAITLGIAGGAAVTLFVILGWLQIPFMVACIPVVFIAIFLLVTMALLQKDANARKRGES